MTPEQILRSPGMWIACIITPLILLAMTALYFRLSLKAAKHLGIKSVKNIVRAAAVTSIGPSFSNILIIVSMVAMLGPAFTLQGSNYAGAPRSKLTLASMCTELIGQTLGENLDLTGLSFLLWGIPMGCVGWFIVTLFCTPNMNSAIGFLEYKFDPKLIKMILGCSSLGVFSYLLCNNVIGKPNYYYALASILGCAVVLIINALFKNNKLIVQLGSGIAILVSVIITGITQNMIG